MRHLLLGFLVAAVAPAGAGALERHVPGDHATVTAALNAAQAGDVIVVGPGVFPLATSRSGIQLTIRGAGMNATVLDGNGATLLALADSTLAIEGLTLRDGSDGVGASGSQVSLDSVRVELCSDGVDMSDSSLVAVDSEFVTNSDDGIDLDDASSLACLRCTITDNGDDGIDLDDASSLACLRCTITDNGDDGIEVRLHDFVGPSLEIEVGWSRIERNEEVGIQLIDYPATLFATTRSWKWKLRVVEAQLHRPARAALHPRPAVAHDRGALDRTGSGPGQPSRSSSVSPQHCQVMPPSAPAASESGTAVCVAHELALAAPWPSGIGTA